MPRRRIDLAFRPKSYWPSRTRGRSTGEGELEIVRIALATASRDAIVLKASRAGGRIAYRMVHEDMRGPTRQRIRVKPPSSARPLTLGQMIELLENACYTGRCHPADERFRGVVWGTLALHFEHCAGCADDYLFMLRVSSRLYPQLERYYGERIDEWCLANCSDELAA